MAPLPKTALSYHNENGVVSDGISLVHGVLQWKPLARSSVQSAVSDHHSTRPAGDTAETIHRPDCQPSASSPCATTVATHSAFSRAVWYYQYQKDTAIL